MQLTPRYDGPTLLTIDSAIGDPSVPMVRQRRRMVEALGRLAEPQWREPSRCEGWSVQDVVSHLVGTNQFWALSIGSGLAGKPTRFLATFDPVATPPQMVEPMRALPAAEARRRADGGERLELLAGVERLFGLGDRRRPQRRHRSQRGPRLRWPQAQLAGPRLRHLDVWERTKRANPVK